MAGMIIADTRLLSGHVPIQQLTRIRLSSILANAIYVAYLSQQVFFSCTCMYDCMVSLLFNVHNQ
jgi:hypothetical protein